MYAGIKIVNLSCVYFYTPWKCIVLVMSYKGNLAIEIIIKINQIDLFLDADSTQDYMGASEPKWVNPVLNLIGVNY